MALSCLKKSGFNQKQKVEKSRKKLKKDGKSRKKIKKSRKKLELWKVGKNGLELF
jgi:hypothetical protein